MKKRTFYAESAYIIAVFLMAVGTALTERAALGVSMVVAPAYLLHLRVSEMFEFFSFGMAGYTLQAVLLLVMMALLRRGRISYLFSFVTAVIFGFALDGVIAVLNLFPETELLISRIMLYLIGISSVSAGVSLMFHTYIPPEVYDLFVKEVTAAKKLNVTKFKTAYDCISCLLSIALSFIFFGEWRLSAVGFGTVFCALVNGSLIGSFSKFFEKHWEFRDALPLRKYF